MLKTLLTVLFLEIFYFSCISQTNTVLQGQIKKNGDSLLRKEKVFLLQAGNEIPVDSAITDSNGVFHFKDFAYGDYSIGLKIAGVDNTAADVIGINTLNPRKRNQHFKIDDGSLVCTENNFQNIKDALENKENVYTLNLNSLQHDVAEKSLIIAADSRKLSPKIGEFTNLESLAININQITVLPPEIGKLEKLTSLTANLNKLSSLPAEMENLKVLKILDLGKNNFQQFPELITKYIALETLNLENNPIPALPASISVCENLKELNLANCSELMALPPQIGDLYKLETLNLSKCTKLKSLPEELNTLKNLKVLDVTGTKLSTKSFQKAVPTCEVRK